MNRNRPKRTDFDLLSPLIPDPARLPFSFVIGDRIIEGIPSSFSPSITTEKAERFYITTVKGTDPEYGITVTFNCHTFLDYPVTEWVVSLENCSDNTTPVIRDLMGGKLDIELDEPVLAACNGDGVGGIGYHTDYISLNEGSESKVYLPMGGRPCSGAFPYFSVHGRNHGYHLVIGWPGQWLARFTPTKWGFSFEAKQYHTHFKLNPHERVRTPRILLMAFDGSEDRGRNLWRRYYFDHIIPRPYPAFPEPLIFCHEADREGAEWTQATEEGQIRCLRGFLDRGVPFNGWWIDAGWFPCGGDWGNTGAWFPDPDRFPNGMKPIGDLCAENNIRFLLWFEPERTRMISRDPAWKDEWLLDWVRINGDGKEEISRQYLYDLGNDEARIYMTEQINRVIARAGVRIFRSDFNILPWGHWTCSEHWDRRGFTENKYICGYLKMWQDILNANPGILIDSCASGGQRNDLETMRLSIPLQYTDCGIGANEPYKCAFSRTLFGWLPYFRQHCGMWGGEMDNYSYHLALAPALTYLMPHTAPEETISYIKRMDPIYRRCADLMLRGDYYPLLPDTRRHDGAYAVQFHEPNRDCGFIQIIRHAKNDLDAITVFPKGLQPNRIYRLNATEYDEECINIDGFSLMNRGFTASIPQRSGRIWLYEAL